MLALTMHYDSSVCPYDFGARADAATETAETDALAIDWVVHAASIQTVVAASRAA